MKKIGVRNIYFTGSRGYFERLVWKDETAGTYWVRWYWETVQVTTENGEDVTGGWRTVEAY